jgi:hypothetical protein
VVPFELRIIMIGHGSSQYSRHMTCFASALSQPFTAFGWLTIC